MGVSPEQRKERLFFADCWLQIQKDSPRFQRLLYRMLAEIRPISVDAMKLLLEEIRRLESVADETVDVVVAVAEILAKTCDSVDIREFLEMSKTAPFSYQVKKEVLLDRVRHYATGATIASWSQLCRKVGVSSSECVAAFMWKVAGDASGSGWAGDEA